MRGNESAKGWGGGRYFKREDERRLVLGRGTCPGIWVSGERALGTNIPDRSQEGNTQERSWEVGKKAGRRALGGWRRKRSARRRVVRLV